MWVGVLHVGIREIVFLINLSLVPILYNGINVRFPLLDLKVNENGYGYHARI